MFVLRCLAAFLFVLKAYPVWSVCALFLLSYLFSKCPKQPSFIVSALSTLFLCYFANLFVGHFVRNPLLMLSGDVGEATVVAVEQTSSLYNDQPVMRHEVMIRPQSGGEVLHTYFETDEFNVSPQPTDDGYIYPQVGMQFNVRYLSQFPRALVILSDDDSPYSRGLRCQRYRAVASKLSLQMQFDPSNAAFQATLAQAQAAMAKACN